MPRLDDRDPWKGVCGWVTKGFQGVGQMVEQLARDGRLTDQSDARLTEETCRRVLAALTAAAGPPGRPGG